jgi:hypothetical protein
MDMNIFLNYEYKDGHYRNLPISGQSQWFGVYKNTSRDRYKN